MKNQRGESIVSLRGRAKEGKITLLVGKRVDSKKVIDNSITLLNSIDNSTLTSRAPKQTYNGLKTV